MKVCGCPGVGVNSGVGGKKAPEVSSAEKVQGRKNLFLLIIVASH